MGLRSLAVVVATFGAAAFFGSEASATPVAARCSTSASTLAVVSCGHGAVVASLDPRYRTGTPRFRLSGALVTLPRCQPSEFVFYAARDWLRLAAKLAEHASPCADYYVSIPPLVADKTLPRPNQAWRFRQLGPRFHALAEIHWATWRQWARTEGRTMYDAGVEARRRMAAAGYDVPAGDTWALNEFPSSVRRNVGTARTDARDFVRGLYEGAGQPAQGAVFVIGVRHGTADASQYKATLKKWLADMPFWAEMERTVRFWGQEVYADARRWGVPGADPTVRRDYLSDFLDHAARLGSLSPDHYSNARRFLARTHTAVANAGWQWPTGLGWTMVSDVQMRHFISSQTYALRHYAARNAKADRFGFAWAPNNATGIPAADFVAQTDALLDRLGDALAESGSEWQYDAGIRACVLPGLDWCRADIADASFTNAWQIFETWDGPVPAEPSVRERVAARMRQVARTGPRLSGAR